MGVDAADYDNDGWPDVFVTALSLEGYVLSPLVFQRSVDIPPLVTMSAQVVLGTMLGVLGVVFATPLTACALVLVKRVYIEDVLGDDSREAA